MRERRRVPRYMFGVTGRLSPAGGGPSSNVTVRIISTEGCAIEGETDLRPGQKCEFYLDWRGVEIGVTAEVAWKTKDGRMGLKFRSVDRDTQRRLSDLCTTLRLQGPTGSAPKDSDTSPGLRRSESAPPPPPRKPAAAPPRRQVPRYASEMKAHLNTPAAASPSNVTIVILSVSGCCLEGENLPAPGTKCELSADWEGKQIRLQGEVVWKANQNQAGVKFLTLREDTVNTIRNICATLRLMPMGRLPLEAD